MMGRWCLLPTLLVACTTGNPAFVTPDDTDDTDATDTTDDADDTSGAASSTAPDASTTTLTGAASDSSDGRPDASTGEPDPMTSGSASGLTAPGSESGGDTTTDACTDECGTPGCGVCPELDMIDLPGFAIAAREASNADYALFLAAGVDPGAQPDVCAWNSEFTPTTWPVPATARELPVVNIDWCDAQAFCAWSGKRLCGAIGGGASSFSAIIDAQADQWYRACSGGIGMKYPYGTAYDGDTCNGKDAGVAAPVVGGAFAACQGPVTGLFDLSGNVWEWVDACDGDAGADDECLRRGGSFKSVPDDMRCDLLSKRPRSLALDHVGVRCCAD